MLVLEWMEGGSVRDALADGRLLDNKRVASDVARAMQFVSAPKGIEGNRRVSKAQHTTLTVLSPLLSPSPPHRSTP